MTLLEPQQGADSLKRAQVRIVADHEHIRALGQRSPGRYSISRLACPAASVVLTASRVPTWTVPKTAGRTVPNRLDERGRQSPASSASLTSWSARALSARGTLRIRHRSNSRRAAIASACNGFIAGCLTL